MLLLYYTFTYTKSENFEKAWTSSWECWFAFTSCLAPSLELLSDVRNNQQQGALLGIESDMTCTDDRWASLTASTRHDTDRNSQVLASTCQHSQETSIFWMFWIVLALGPFFLRPPAVPAVTLGSGSRSEACAKTGGSPQVTLQQIALDARTRTKKHSHFEDSWCMLMFATLPPSYLLSFAQFLSYTPSDFAPVLMVKKSTSTL